jgi:hypothetical protein
MRIGGVEKHEVHGNYCISTAIVIQEGNFADGQDYRLRRRFSGGGSLRLACGSLIPSVAWPR